MKHLRHIVCIGALLLSQWIAATLVVNGTPDPNWLGGNTAFNTTEGNDFWLTFLNIDIFDATKPENKDVPFEMKVIVSVHEPMDIVIAAGNSVITTLHIDKPDTTVIYEIDRDRYAETLYLFTSEQAGYNGVHVYAAEGYKDKSFSCFSYCRKDNSANSSRDASLVLPTHALGKEYYIQTSPEDLYSTQFAVVATEDGTEVTITPSYETYNGVQPNSTPISITLNKGQAYLVASRLHKTEDPDYKADLSGSTICATKPVAVFNGNQKTSVPIDPIRLRDYNSEQSLPIAQYGTEFYFSKLEHMKAAYFRVTAAYNNTKVQIKSEKAAVGSNLTLQAGESSKINLYTVGKNADQFYIKSDHPIICYAYLSSANDNLEEIDLGGGQTMDVNFGNPANAMIPAWSHRVNEMRFFTHVLDPQAIDEDNETPQHFYVYLVTKASDAGSVTVDGVSVGTQFHTFGPNTQMAYAHIEVDTVSAYHTVQAGGEGFVGMVYALSHAQGYFYTLGYNPSSEHDSLYVENVENVMSSKSYNLDRVAGKGWYQRQLGEWIKTRLDTASVCDTTTLLWMIETPIDTLFRVDSIHWIISRKEEVIATLDTVIKKGETKHRWEYEFILPEEVIAAREPYAEYKIQALLYRTPLLCNDLRLDTLQTMVRVHTAYKDTTWVILCTGDEYNFFSDTTLTTPSERYSTLFYYDEATTAAIPADRKYKYHTGADSITHSYTSEGGCDSTSTLMLYVCESIRNTIDTTLCEKDLKGLNAKLGYFFSSGYNTKYNIDFAESFSNREGSSAALWDQLPDGSWYFDGTSFLKTYRCKDDIPNRWKINGAYYDGCDSTLTLHMRVLTTKVIKKDTSICTSTFDWRDNDGNLIETFYKSESPLNTLTDHTHLVPYKVCNACPEGGCDSLRYELTLMFVDGPQATDTVHVCQNEGTITRTHMGQTWIFDPEGQPVNTPIDGVIHTFTPADGCTYDFHFVFFIDTLPLHRDSIVYCYDENQPTITHTWTGHDIFWYNEKGSSVKYKSGSVSTTYPSLAEGRRIYELSDTVRSTTEGACDDVYYQVVIVMPSYHIHTEKHIADTAYHEWSGKILAGENANTALIDNQEGLEIVVLRPTIQKSDYTWLDSVKYIPELQEYYLETSYTTDEIHNAEGVAQKCDSAVSISIRVGKVFRDTTYTYTCSNEQHFSWWSYDEQGAHWRKSVEVPQVTTPTEIFYYDSLKTRWPVIGLDSIYVLSLTVFPAFDDTVQLDTCQIVGGYKWPQHMGPMHNLFINDVPMDPEWDSIPIDEKGHFYVQDRLTTHEKEYRHPRVDTLIASGIVCDSIWTLDLTVNEVYDSIYTYIEFTRGLKSNDTMTFYNPKTLFIGEDFEDYRSGIKTADELRIEAGADQVEIVTQDSLYSKTSDSQFGCDSTTYLRLSLCVMEEKFFTDTIGDNDTTWTFGGDTTPDELGYRTHTQPLVTGKDFHVDSLDYYNLDPTARPMREYQFTDSMKTEKGCDSIIHMTLRVFATYKIYKADTTCSSERYDWRGYQNLNKKEGDEKTGVAMFYDSLETKAGGVDSVYILALTIFPNEDVAVSKELCYNDTIIWHGLKIYYIEGATEITHQFKDPDARCERIYHLHPIYDPAYGYIEDPNYKDYEDSVYHVCQYEDFDWIDKKGNLHTLNLRDANGKKYSKIPTDRCGWFTLYDSLKTKGCNCDSVYTLHYHVDTTYRYYTDLHLCTGETYDWIVNGSLYKQYEASSVGDIYDTIKGSTTIGCDSSYYLHIRIDSTYFIPVEMTLCPSEISTFTWNGRSYDAELADARNWDAPHEFNQTFRTTTVGAGCDSIMQLHLIILPNKDSIWGDTICEGEQYAFYGRTLTTSGTYTDVHPNQWGCAISYILTLDVLPPTTFVVSADPVCVEHKSAGNSYGFHYTYHGEFEPKTYNIYYDEAAQAAGFENLYDVRIPVPMSIHYPDVEHVIDIEIPDFGSPENYPAPGHYNAVIGFDNAVCDGDSLMRYPFRLNVNYPSWLTEQRHGDLIGLLNESLNGSYTWTQYQWYEGDSLLVGQTKPYLHIPTGLNVGAEYHVELWREGDTEPFRTCPIVAIPNPVVNDYAPQQGYLAVTPTCVLVGHPYVNILSRKDGTYRISTNGGQLLSQGVFRADVTPIELPAVEGLYIIQLWSNDTPEEPYRAIKVIVSQQCPNCDISSF